MKYNNIVNFGSFPFGKLNLILEKCIDYRAHQNPSPYSRCSITAQAHSRGLAALKREKEKFVVYLFRLVMCTLRKLRRRRRCQDTKSNFDLGDARVIDIEW